MKATVVFKLLWFFCFCNLQNAKEREQNTKLAYVLCRTTQHFGVAKMQRERPSPGPSLYGGE